MSLEHNILITCWSSSIVAEPKFESKFQPLLVIWQSFSEGCSMAELFGLCVGTALAGLSSKLKHRAFLTQNSELAVVVGGPVGAATSTLYE